MSCGTGGIKIVAQWRDRLFQTAVAQGAILVVSHGAVHDVVRGRLEGVGLLGGVTIHPGIQRLHGRTALQGTGGIAHRPGIEVSRGRVVIGPAENDEQRNDDSHDESAHASPLSWLFRSVAGGFIIVL